LASALPAVQIRFVESWRVAHGKERSEGRAERKAMRIPFRWLQCWKPPHVCIYSTNLTNSTINLIYF